MSYWADYCIDIDETNDTIHAKKKSRRDQAEYIFDKLREILQNHELLPRTGNTDENEVDFVLDQIDTLCRDVDKYRRKYMKHSKHNKQLRNKLKTTENTFVEVVNERDELKQKHFKLQQQNQALIEKLNEMETPSTMGSTPDDTFYEYKQAQMRFESMCEPLRDVANAFEMELLKDTLYKLTQSLNDYSIQLQMHTTSETTDATDHDTQTLVSMSVNVDEMDALYPDSTYREDDDDRKDELEHYRRYTRSSSMEFDAHFPVVRRIEIGGNWFNKKARAVIEWNGSTFTRKMADFKWLWRMLLLNSSVDRVVPDYPNDIPESLWPQGYLRRRKRELNLFLMQCHSLPWIKNYNLYYDIFLEQEKHEWKRKRDEFDEEIMQKIKKKEATYIQHTIDKNNNANNSDNNDNDTNHHNNNNNQYHQ
eukprot:1140371_1